MLMIVIWMVAQRRRRRIRYPIGSYKARFVYTHDELSAAVSQTQVDQYKSIAVANSLPSVLRQCDHHLGHLQDLVPGRPKVQGSYLK